MMKKPVRFIAALCLAVLTACGSRSGASASADTVLYSVGETAAEAYDMAAGAMNRAVTEEMAYVTDDLATADDGLSSKTDIQPVNSSRKLIRTVDLTVETTEFDSLLSSLNQSVAEIDGYTEQSDISGNSLYSDSSRRHASLVLRIPSDHLDSFLSQVEGLGNIINKSESVQDVTLNYTDIESRKKTLLVEQERLLELLAEAESVDAVIALESRLSDIRYQLESMESQLRTYDNQVDYSTVYLYISEVAVLTPTVPDSVATRIRKGFSENIRDIAVTATNAFVWFVSHIPALIVLLVILAILIPIIRKIVKRIRRRKEPQNPS
ncbi:MAG: DUF4349 domain-containing protein [Clostridiales bacterium]|nr:DUF4349 domain-containing protein [Clostridiales bacterium]